MTNYIKRHERKIQEYDITNLLHDLGVVLKHKGGWAKLQKLAYKRFLEGHERYGKWRKLNYKKEASEEVADFINYMIQSKL